MAALDPFGSADSDPTASAGPDSGDDAPGFSALLDLARRREQKRPHGAPGPASDGGQGGRPGPAPIDLDSEEGLAAAELESAELVARIARRRAGARSAPAPPPSVAQLDLSARQSLSTVTVGLRSLLAQLRDTRDNVHVHAGNAAKLQRGAQPHGYPDLGLGGSGAEELEGLRAGLAILRDRLAASGRALTDAAENAEKLERDLALARRAYETLAAASAPGSS